jgi:hypothetical protein
MKKLADAAKNRAVGYLLLTFNNLCKLPKNRLHDIWVADFD